MFNLCVYFARWNQYNLMLYTKFPKILLLSTHYTPPVPLQVQGVKLIFFSDSHLAPKFSKW